MIADRLTGRCRPILLIVPLVLLSFLGIPESVAAQPPGPPAVAPIVPNEGRVTAEVLKYSVWNGQ